MTNKRLLWWTLALLWCLATIYVSSDVTIFWGLFFAQGIGALLGIAWLIRVVVALRGTERRLRLLLLSAEALVCITVLLICAVRGPMIVRFRLSRAALRAYAESGKISAKPVTIGLYHFLSVKKQGETVIFDLGSPLFDEIGFAYSPKTRPKDEGLDFFQPFQGPWYWWQRRWG